MTDAEISRKLALAIGYRPEDVQIEAYHGLGLPDMCTVRRLGVLGKITWKTLDYRDPAVIWPIAEHFRCFPAHCHDLRGNWYAWCQKTGGFVYADTAAKAVALAVIAAHGG